jgi:hypothetical protein
MLSKELEATLHRSLAYATERRHAYATIEHLLAALIEDPEVISLLLACGANVDRLRDEVRDYVDNELKILDAKTGLVIEYSGEPKPTASFQRVLQRAAIHVAASGNETVTGANVLVAMFAEHESHAVYYLKEQGVTRVAAVSYIVHGISNPPQSDKQTVQSDKHTITEAIRLTGIRTGRIGQRINNIPETAVRSIFISYSHKDSRWISRLEVHLRPIVDTGCLTYWDDRKIKPGNRWQQEIRQAIDAASIAILMISADYLASEFITKNELPPLLRAAEERGCHILPIILSPCRFLRTPSLAEFQAVNPASRPLTAMTKHQREALFVRVTETIEDLPSLSVPLRPILSS